MKDAFALSFKEALARLSDGHGESPRNWQWGKRYAQQFPHAFSGVPVLGAFFDLGTPTAGGRLTLNRDIASYRMLVDLADLGRSRSGITTGQAGHPFSRHYNDQLEGWRRVRPHPMLWERESVQDRADATLVLLPAARPRSPP